jgi:YVTN family beta-propeller protein
MAAICTAAIAKPKEKAPAKDAYAEYVWPAPPDEARIRLVDILSMRADVEASSRFTRALIGASPDDLYSRLLRPIGCAFDAKGRLLVTDAQLTAVLRFDRKGRRMDVLGTTGALKLKLPMGINVGADGRIYVADAGAQRVVAFDEEGKSLAAYGRKGELVNPTDSALSPDGTRLYVTDSKANKIVVFDVATSKVLTTLGEEGAGEGQFNRPSAIAVDRDGSIFVVDAINARIQILSPDGEFLQTLGALGTAPGQFVRPKDVAIDAEGRVYVSDGAFNNVQVFDKDLQLLTFVGDAGGEPGRFQIPGGIGIGGKHFAVVDQLGARIEVFEHIPEAPKAESSGQ